MNIDEKEIFLAALTGIVSRTDLDPANAGFAKATVLLAKSIAIHARRERLTNGT